MRYTSETMSRIHTPAPSSEILRQIDEFFMKTGPVQQTLHNLAQRLSEEDIDYAVIGGMALALHGLVRPTQDAALARVVFRDRLRRLRRRIEGSQHSL